MAGQELELDLPRFRVRHDAVRERIAELAEGRPAPTIVVVSKYLSPADCRELRAEGFGPLGENRAQDLVHKVGPGEDRAGWHFIGHLQRNKVHDVLPRIGRLHSLDSERLARHIDAWIDESGSPPLPCLVQVNISGEGTKGGLSRFEASERVPAWIESFGGLGIDGLMTMAPEGDPELAGRVFRSLRELRDEIRAGLPPDTAERFCELSMGMSEDWEFAVREGATLLRLGRLLYS